MRPNLNYEEARANKYPSARLYKRTKINNPRSSVRTTLKLNHLSGRTLRYVPGAGGKKRLKIKVALNSAKRGGAWVITINRKGKAPRTKVMPIRANGHGIRRVDFRRSKVKWVDVTLVNASTRYKCNLRLGWDHTCQGRARDNKRQQAIKAVLIK